MSPEHPGKADVDASLATRYETLRSIALGDAEVAPSGRGLAVLMYRGVAAWMQAWEDHAPPPMPERAQGTGFAAATIHPDVVRMLTEIAMTAARTTTR